MPDAVLDKGRQEFDESEKLSNLESFRIIKRAFSYVKPFKKEFAVKVSLAVFSVLPMLVVVWPTRVIVDHVISGIRIGDQPTRFPFFVRPWVEALADSSPVTILLWMLFVQFILLVVIGQFGVSGGQSDTAEAGLATGVDTATTTENSANSGFSLVGGLVGLFDFRWTMRLSQKLNHLYRSRLYERMRSLPMRDFDNERIGDAVYRVMYDTPAVTDVCYRLLLTPIVGIFSILLTISVMIEVYGWNSPIVYAALSFMPIVLIATLPLSSRIRRTSGQSRKTGATTTATLEEGMSNIMAVQSLGGQGRQRGQFDQDSNTSFRDFRLFMLIAIMAGAVGWFFSAFVIIWTMFYIGDSIIAGKLTVGDFTVLMTYFGGIGMTTGRLGSLWINLQGNAAGLNRVFFIMDRKGEEDQPGALALGPVREGLKMEGLHYQYEVDAPVLQGIDFEAKVGQFTAFVGPAGVGKTSLAYMIPRFLKPDSGRVLIDGTDISKVTFDSLRSQIAFVFQETLLFDATIEENIRFGNPEATGDEVKEAARIARADQFIEEMEQGYQTPLGRAGGKLSGGQKQRVSIARALVRKAPILILDEPTSALDSETEHSLVKALREASQNRIVIVIAHRLSTVRNADQILFLGEGKILERGSHDELMAKENGAYRHYVDLQTKGTL